MSQFLLLPIPKQVTFHPTDAYHPVTPLPATPLDLFALMPTTGLYCREFTPAERDALRAMGGVHADQTLLQAYHIEIDTNGITVAADHPAGRFYAACTLAQLISQATGALPSVTIADIPDFTRRGVMLDISRDRVPRMDTLKGLIDLLVSWKVNEVQLYTEHTFAYRNHRTVWENASPMTAEEIRELDRYCKERFVDLVPNQNSFGHFHRWLKHPDYVHLAEYPEGFDWPIFLGRRPFSLNAADPATFALLDELFAELLPNFSSPYFNVGCDETFDLGKGRTKELVEELGVGRVYVEFLKKISTLVHKNGKRMMFWGDIITEHPELVGELPKELIAMAWGYEATHPFDKEAAQFAVAGLPFYVCPGTSSWLSLIGRTHNALGNLSNAAAAGIKHGAIGYLNTDWGDFGHWQTHPVNHLGFAYGAAFSWAYEVNSAADLQTAFGHFAFGSEPMGQWVYELGNLYQLVSDQPHVNSITMTRYLLYPLANIPTEKWYRPVNPELVQNFLNELDQHAAKLETLTEVHPLIKREYRLMIALIKHGSHRMLFLAGDSTLTKASLATELAPLRAEHEALWWVRSRHGGLSDSLERMDRLLREYAE
jgi:hypothetical protein